MDNETDRLDRQWNAKVLLCFALPTVAMMMFMGMYTVVDTIFVARFVNADALSAINIVCPVINLTVGLGTMLAAGGNAVISRNMGAGEHQRAREEFTLLVITGTIVGSCILLLGILKSDAVISMLGASDRLFAYCRDYLLVLSVFAPANVLQTLFSNLFVTAGRPGLGLVLSVLSGVANIVLDYIFIVLCGLGIRGAALGTGFGYLIPACAGLVYFARSRGALSFTKPAIAWAVTKRAVIEESCLNGSSELVSQLATAITTFLFNRTTMRLLGEEGVAAITILIYSQFLLNTLYIGFAIGIAPIVGFYYGSGNRIRRKQVIRLCLCLTAAASVLIFALSLAGGPRIVQLFAEETSEVCRIATEGFSIFACGFLFCGLNIVTSAIFTAQSNGKVSAVLSFLRTFVLLAGGILLLPHLWGIAGVWLAVPVAEGIMCIVSAGCLLHDWKRPGR